MIDIEEAVEVVVRWLEEQGHHDLARAVSEATDPTPADEQAAAVAAARAFRASLPLAPGVPPTPAGG